MSKTYSLEREQVLPVTMDEAWDFFSSPANLAHITPAHLKFNIVSPRKNEEMYAGQVIEYTVRPVLNFPMYWMTEITQVKKHTYFIDEQRYGPYSLWHHQHHFKETARGIAMTDIVHYRLPFWWLGDIANQLFVKKQLAEIFDYRFKVVEEKFGR